jgi:hypothetical protein
MPRTSAPRVGARTASAWTCESRREVRPFATAPDSTACEPTPDCQTIAQTCCEDARFRDPTTSRRRRYRPSPRPIAKDGSSLTQVPPKWAEAFGPQEAGRYHTMPAVMGNVGLSRETREQFVIALVNSPSPYRYLPLLAHVKPITGFEVSPRVVGMSIGQSVRRTASVRPLSSGIQGLQISDTLDR